MLKQEPSKGAHPSSSKGSDVVVKKEKFIGVSADQSDDEVGVLVEAIEAKTTGGKMSNTSLNKLVEKNKAVQQIAQQDGKYYEDLQKVAAEAVADLVDEGKTLVLGDLRSRTIGIAKTESTSNKPFIPVTDEQMIVQTGPSLDQILHSFDNPQDSDYVETTDLS